MTTSLKPSKIPTIIVARMNNEHHRVALIWFMIVVLAHWAEHLAQAAQIWVFGWDRAEAHGVLGVPFPWLVESEWLHYGYAIIMLIGLWLLRPGFVGRAAGWWIAALIIQAWHHVEHLALLLQSLSGAHLAGRETPVSFVEIVVPRVELHLFYNAVVFVPMIVAMYYHLRPNHSERHRMTCSCVHQPDNRSSSHSEAR